MNQARSNLKYSRLVKMNKTKMDSGTFDAPFEVVFRGPEDDNDTLQMNSMVTTTGTSNEFTDLSREIVSEDRSNTFIMQTLRSNGGNVVEEDSPLRETHSDPFEKPRCIRDMSNLTVIIASMIIFCVGITIAMIIQIIVGSPQVIPHAGVISDDDECSKIGIEVLSESTASIGSASSVDAALLTALCSIVKNPHKGGLGGGGFMLIEKQHDARNDVIQVNFREMSPGLTDVKLNVTRDNVSLGQSVAVPGFIHGMKLAHEMFGKASWKKIFEEASKLASDGIKVTDDLSSAINTLDLTSAPDDLKNLVTENDNTTKLTTNDTLVQSELAETLLTIADDPDAFYKGDLAQTLVDTLAKHESKITMQDMKNYEADLNSDVLKVKYSNMAVAAGGPPSSGPVVLSSLKYMSKYPIKNNITSDPLTYHRLLEAIKYSYGYQPSWETTEQVNSSLQDSALLGDISDNQTFSDEHYLNGTEPLQLNRGGEQHVTVVGYDGLIVTIVMGIGSPFGSKLMSSGYVLNNAMLDFSWPGKSTLVPETVISQANMIAGNKRPMSLMSNVLVLPSATKCGLYLGFDAHEDTDGISALLQIILKKGSGMDVSASIKSGRLSQDMYPFSVGAEDTVPANVITKLKELDHDITQLGNNETIADCNALSYHEGIVAPYIDKRDDDDTAYTF